MNLPAVSVLTDSRKNVAPSELQTDGEARESTTARVGKPTVGNSAGAERNSDSRGGSQSTLRSMQTEKGAQSVKLRGDGCAPHFSGGQI
jgi:hypothetical protein